MSNENDVITEAVVNEGGKIVFAPDVIATIASLAALEVEGVESMSGTVVEGISDMLGGKKSLTKGVKIDIAEDCTTIDMIVIIKYGVKIHEVCHAVQLGVKNAVETMTGLKVTAVNVSVASITFEKAEPVKKDKEEAKE